MYVNISLYSFESINDICFIAQCTEKRRHGLQDGSRHQSFWSDWGHKTQNYLGQGNPPLQGSSNTFCPTSMVETRRTLSFLLQVQKFIHQHGMRHFFVSQPSSFRCTTKVGLPGLFYDTESDCIMDYSPLIVFKGRDKTSNVYGSWWVCMNRILE